jgi:carbonic anhydrase
VRLGVEIGNANAVLATLWEHLPKTAGQTEKVPDLVNAGGLLPADRGYWTYTGSLTTPPCTEDVRWFVFEQEISIGRDQSRAFAALFKINSRPLQDAHGRRIEADE